MQKYALSELTEKTFDGLVTLYERPDVSDRWDQMTLTLSPKEIGLLNEIETGKPKFTVELSKTYNGILEAERIVQILKSIVDEAHHYALALKKSKR